MERKIVSFFDEETVKRQEWFVANLLNADDSEPKRDSTPADEHKCEGIVSGYTEIEQVDDVWYLNLNGNCCCTEISFCPFCGEYLGVDE
ncbi:hypothetical protein D1872_89850 [compost metagenome]